MTSARVGAPARAASRPAGEPARGPVPAHPRGLRPAEPLMRTLLGAALRRRRQGLGRTLTAVAREARVSVAYLSEVERGRKEPSSEVLVAVARALGWHLADLLTEVVIELRSGAPRASSRPAATRPATHAPERALAPAAEPEGPRCRRGEHEPDEPVCLTAA